MKKVRRVKTWLAVVMFFVFGLSLLFTVRANAEIGIIKFYINFPGSGAMFDSSSRLSAGQYPNDLYSDDRFESNQTVLVRTLKDRTRALIRTEPKIIGKPGYTLRNIDWNTNELQGGTLWTGLASKTFNNIFPSNGANIKNLYLIWQPKSGDKVDLTYDSNSNGEVPNPPTRVGKIAGERFKDGSEYGTVEELKSPGKRHGYNFDAWYSEPGYKVGYSNKTDKSIKVTPVDADPSIYNGTTNTATLVKKTLPLKAEWLKKSGNVKVEFLDPSSNKLLDTISAMDMWGDLAFSGIKPEKEGYRLMGWTTPDGESVGVDDTRTPVSMDIDLKPGGTLKLYAQWKFQSKLTINYKDRELNDLGLPSSTEFFDTGSDWAWKDSYDLPVTEKILVAHRVNGGDIIEGKPAKISMAQNMTLDLIYGHDKVGPDSTPGSDGTEDFQIDRNWEQEDGSLVDASLTPKVMFWNYGENFNKDYAYDTDIQKFKSFTYLGYYINHDKNSFQTGTPNLRINGNGQFTYVFRKTTYDLRIHYIDIKGNPLSPDMKLLPKELVDSQAYTIEPSKLDDFGGMAPSGWYLGAPKSQPVNSNELNEMSESLTVSGIAKKEVDVTIVYDNLISVTLPLSMKFVVTDEATRAVSSENYKITNNSSSSKLNLKLDTNVDVKINKNSHGISLISAPRTDNARTEELYLALKSDLSSFGEQTLAADSATVSGELAAKQSMNLTLSGKYHGEIPNEESAKKEFEGQLIWHFTPKLK
ncbi:MAG: hypothetical protein LBV19_01995 [Streptococcaceae bacterium]|jgi:uncharacterized repeat protein (TIGR02543 family)|nr:hypothetical protein [Streptococcaceae bacterium]